jgi:hypothetical protein
MTNVHQVKRGLTKILVDGYQLIVCVNVSPNAAVDLGLAPRVLPDVIIMSDLHPFFHHPP